MNQPVSCRPTRVGRYSGVFVSPQFDCRTCELEDQFTYSIILVCTRKLHRSQGCTQNTQNYSGLSRKQQYKVFKMTDPITKPQYLDRCLKTAYTHSVKIYCFFHPTHIAENTYTSTYILDGQTKYYYRLQRVYNFQNHASSVRKVMKVRQTWITKDLPLPRTWYYYPNQHRGTRRHTWNIFTISNIYHKVVRSTIKEGVIWGSWKYLGQVRTMDVVSSITPGSSAPPAHRVVLIRSLRNYCAQ